MKKIKISELPLYSSIKGLFTIGTDSKNESVKVSLESEFAKKQDKLSASNPVTREMVAQGAVSTSKIAGLSVTRAKLAKEVTDELEEKADVIFIELLTNAQRKAIYDACYDGIPEEYQKTVFIYKGLTAELNDETDFCLVQIRPSYDGSLIPSFENYKILINEDGSLTETYTGAIPNDTNILVRDGITTTAKSIALTDAQALAVKNCRATLEFYDGTTHYKLHQSMAYNTDSVAYGIFVGYAGATWTELKFQLTAPDETFDNVQLWSVKRLLGGNN